MAKMNDALSAGRDAYKALVCDVLSVAPEELDRLIEGALAVVSGCAIAGWEIGSMLGGEHGGVVGAALGATIGVVIIVGAITYRILIKRTEAGLIALPLKS